MSSIHPDPTSDELERAIGHQQNVVLDLEIALGDAKVDADTKVQDLIRQLQAARTHLRHLLESREAREVPR
jgi:hypothetical protein